MSSKKPVLQRRQGEASIAAPKAAEVDEDEKRGEARLRAVAKPPAKPVKKGK
jgi:hypothetical protein